MSTKPVGPIYAAHKEVEEAQERRNYDPNYFVNLYDYDFLRTADNIDLAPKNWAITYYLQYIEKDLLLMQKNLMRKGGPSMAGQDLFIILKKMIVALSFLQSRNKNHGDLTPQNIMIDAKGTPLLFPGGWRPAPITITQEDFAADLEFYLSPEKYAAMCGVKGEKINEYRSEIFS